jgi:hypothetical protein
MVRQNSSWPGALLRIIQKKNWFFIAQIILPAGQKAMSRKQGFYLVGGIRCSAYCMFVFNSVTVVSMHNTHVAEVPLFVKKVSSLFLCANQPVYPSILESNPIKATLIQVNVFL